MGQNASIFPLSQCRAPNAGTVDPEEQALDFKSPEDQASVCEMKGPTLLPRPLPLRSAADKSVHFEESSGRRQPKLMTEYSALTARTPLSTVDSEMFENPITFNEFLTGWFDLIWPKLAEAASKIIHEKLAQALEEAIARVPALKGEVSYSLHLGDAAPVFHAIHSYKRHATEDEGIEVCGQMSWEAQTDMQLRVGPLSMRVKKVSLEGLGCAVAKPLLSKDPVVGGMQLYFVNPPELAMDIKGLGGVTSWSVVDKLMQQVAHDAFSKLMVLPSQMSVRFNNTKIKDYPEFKNPPPRGMLRVHVVDARDLVASDYNLFSEMTSDPYCRLTLGSTSWRTRTIKANCNPVWDGPEDSTDFLVHHERQTLQLDVYDDDLLSKDDFLGSFPAEVSVAGMIHQQRRQGHPGVRVSLDTSEAESDSKEHDSSVNLKLQYFSFDQCKDHQEVFAESSQNPVLVGVKLYHCRGLSIEEAKGAVVRVRITQPGRPEQTEQSKKCRGIHPKEIFGFGQKQSKTMFSLYRSGTPAEHIAAAFDLDEAVVQEAVAVEAGQFQRFGWDETLFFLIHEPATAVGCFEIFLHNRWLPIGKIQGRLEGFVHGIADSHIDSDLGVPLWPVLGHTGGEVFAGVSLDIRKANPLTDAEADHRFTLGRHGGENTKVGMEKVERFLQRKSTTWKKRNCVNQVSVPPASSVPAKSAVSSASNVSAPSTATTASRKYAEPHVVAQDSQCCLRAPRPPSWLSNLRSRSSFSSTVRSSGSRLQPQEIRAQASASTTASAGSVTARRDQCVQEL